MIPARSQIVGKRGYWLLDLDVNGHVYRYATAPVVVNKSDGTTLFYREGLSDLSVSPTVLKGQEVSAAVELTTDVNWSQLVERGGTLVRRSAQLRRWFAGQLFEDARVVVNGLTFDPVYGAIYDPLSLTIAQRRREFTRPLPAAAASVSSETFPITGSFGLNVDMDGAVYPVLIGYPGITATQSAPQPAMPVVIAEGDFVSAIEPATLLVADGHIDATELQLWSLDEVDSTSGLTKSDVFTVNKTYDLLNRPISTISISGTSAPTFSTERLKQKYYTSISTNGTSTGGGLPNLTHSAPLRAAGDVMEHMLSTYSELPLDRGRMAAQRPYLNQVLIDTYINSRVNAWEWLSRSVLPLLPVSEVETSEGIYFQFWRWDATTVDAVAHFDAQLLQLERTSRVETLSQSIVNEFEIRYQPSCTSTSEYHASKVVTGEDDPADSRVVVDYLCKLSQQVNNYGIRAEQVDAFAVWDTASAVRIGKWKAAQFALPKRMIRYSASSSLEAFEIGDIVTLSDSELSLSNTLCLIRELVITATGCNLLLILLDNPVLDSRLTS